MAVPWEELKPGEIAVAHLSDLHFNGKDDEDAWERVRRFLLDVVKPKLVLVTGDLVDSPSDRLFRLARKRLDDLQRDLEAGYPAGSRPAVPYFVCPGNHDRFFLGNRIRRFAWVLRLLAVVATALLIVLLVWGFFRVRGQLAAVIANPGAAVPLDDLPFYLMVLLGIILLFVGLPWLVKKVGGWLPSQVQWYLAMGDPGHQFNIIFDDKLVRAHEPAVRRVTAEGNQWRLGLFGADSCTDADASARGYVDLEKNFQLVKAVEDRGADWDLGIFLVHHHLLSVRSLEAANQGSRRSLLNLTCLVNAGSLLEKLTEAHIDLVLHGHEHAANWAAYASCEDGRGPLHVLAAGSATGKTEVAYDPRTASANVLILSPDRTVRLRQLVHEDGAWQTRKELTNLVGPADLRHSWLRRTNRDPAGKPLKRPILSEITKHVTFTRERDIWTRWVFTDCFPLAEVRHPISNSTGQPRDVKVRLIDRDSNQRELAQPPAGVGPGPNDPVVRLEKSTNDHEWLIQFRLPPEFRDRPLTMEISYRWFGGAIFTNEELLLEKHQGFPLGSPRNEGLEYETIWTPSPAAAALLLVSLPPEFASHEHLPDVRVLTSAGERDTQEEKSLRLQLRELRRGRYALRIPYPRMGCDYQLAWELTTEEEAILRRPDSLAARKRFLQQTENTDQLKVLLSQFAEGLDRIVLSPQPGQQDLVWKDETPADGGPGATARTPAATARNPRHAANLAAGEVRARDHLTVALYAKRADGSVVPVWLDPDVPAAEPRHLGCEGQFRQVADSPPLRRAWGGELTAIVRPERPERADDLGQLGLLQGETAVICVPIRFGLGPANPAPWAVVRIGLQDTAKKALMADDKIGRLRALLAQAALRLLTKALE